MHALKRILLTVFGVFIINSVYGQTIQLPDNDLYVLNVKEAPFNAKGDGISDDTQAIQAAIYASLEDGGTKVVYIPNGNYLISSSLQLSMSDGSPARYGPWIKGENKFSVKILLQNASSAFSSNDTTALFGMMEVPCEGNSQLHEHKSIENISFELNDNPNACAIKMCGQTSMIKHVRINGKGNELGIALGNEQIPSNALVLKSEISNCKTGIQCINEHSNYTLSEVSCRSIGTGILIKEANVSIDNFNYLDGLEAGILADDGKATFNVVNSTFTYNTNNSFLFTFSNFYARSINLLNLSFQIPDNLFGTFNEAGNIIEETYSAEVFKSQEGDLDGMLRIPVKTSPDIEYDENIDNWVNVADFGADCTDDIDDSEAIQNAVDFAVSNNKTTIYFPGCALNGTDVYIMEDQYVTLSGSISHVIGLGYANLKGNGFILNKTYSDEISFQHLYGTFNRLSIENSDVKRTVLIEDVTGTGLTTDNGFTYLNNFAGTISITNPFSETYGRAINTYLYDEDVANEGIVNIVNQGGTLWLSGVRNEQPNSVMATVAGGRSELLGGMMYIWHEAADPILFYTDDAETTIANFRMGGLAANGGVSQLTVDYEFGEIVGGMLYTDTQIPNNIVVYSDADAIVCPPDGTACNDGNIYTSNDLYLDCTCQGNVVQLRMRALLEGLFDASTGTMTTISNQQQIIPNTQPFNKAPFYYGGSEANFNIPYYISDWVLVQLRSKNDPEQILYQKAAFIAFDGSILDVFSITDGIVFPGLPVGEYYVALFHKSHLPIITQNAIPIGTGMVNLLDLSDESQIGGFDPLTAVPNYLNQAMYAGDFDQNGIINNLDYNIWEDENTAVNIYLSHDADANAIINNLDYNWWVKNRSKVGAATLQK